MELISSTSATSTSYSNGANESIYDSLSEALSGSHVVSVSYDAYRVSSYTAYGAPHGTHTTSEIMR